MSEGLRIAMWSGPRNISTAMMRAWENRGDCAVVDEPFYACYLAATGLDHPGREEILASQPTDWRAVVASLVGPIPCGKPIHFQKQMTHHLLQEVQRSWFHRVRHVFLIRDPREVVHSYVKSRSEVTVDDIGVLQQHRIYGDVVATTGEKPPVIDAADFLRDPEGHLRLLCERLGLKFSYRMLRWPPGPRDSDGVWAPHWYDAVQRSTGFEPYTPRSVRLSADQEAVAREAEPAYWAMHQDRLVVRRNGQG